MKKMHKLIRLFLISFVLILPIFVLGQDGSTNTGGNTQGSTNTGAQTGNISYNIKIDNPFKTNTIEGFIKIVVNDILIPIGAVVAVAMIIYSGFLFVTASGNETQISKAKDALLYAVIGSAILLGAWVISEAIQGTIKELES